MTLKKLLRGIAASAAAAAILAGTAFAEPVRLSVVDASQSSVVLADSDSNNNINNAGSAVVDPDNFPVMTDNREIMLQDGMRAVFVTPDLDFPEDKSELMSFFDEAAGYGMNAVMINTVSGNKDNYSLDLAEEDIIKSAIDSARYSGLSVYVTLDADSLLNKVISEGGGLKEGFTAAAHKFAMKYICDGIIITNYYTSDTETMHAEYLRSGSGIGYENWLYETNRYIIRTLSEVIRKTTAATAVGLYIEDMWANSADNEAGSETSADFQALYDGYCDTRSYIEQGYADFILVKAAGSTESTALKFENAVSWWNDLAAKCNVKAYVCHLNENIGNVSGWNVDQILKQLVDMKEIGGFGGSAFNSFAALRENKHGNTTSLIKFFNDQINLGSLDEELTMVLPTQQTYTTSNLTAKFQGTFDENFDVYFNNKKVELNSAGNFFFEERLKIGKNYFTFEHKGKQMNYVITRSFQLFKSISNTSDITVEGGTRIALSAVAYSGSRVSASVNGQVINLTEKQNSETLDANGSYSEFVGYYTTPEGIVGKEQKLGQISYYGVYTEQGSAPQDDGKYGGTVTVAAKPEPPKTDLNIEIKDQSTAGTGEVVGTMDPVIDDQTWTKYIRVKEDYTPSYDPKMTEAVPSPEFSRLPKGTMDYYKSKVGNYIITTSGKRFAISQVDTFTDTGLGENPLEVKAVGNINGKSFIKISLKYKIGFNVTVSQTYFNDIEGAFGVKNFNAEYVYITFDNITSITKLPDFGSCALFSEGVWEKVTENGIPKFRMKLKLRQAGIYNGYAAAYDENGDLMLTFHVPTSSLAGKVIVVDPGHGVNAKGFIDPGGVGEVTEQVIALAVAKKLEEKLTAMGATVVRFNSESEYISDANRAPKGRSYDPDMMLSLHCNSVLDKNPHGVEVYYFTPFSQPLAKKINDGLVDLYDNEIYKDGTNSNRGAKYSYYWYTLEQSFPSVLVEMGFVSNSRECLMMADPENQDAMAERIADGVLYYFSRSYL